VAEGRFFTAIVSCTCPCAVTIGLESSEAPEAGLPETRIPKALAKPAGILPTTFFRTAGRCVCHLKLSQMKPLPMPAPRKEKHLSSRTGWLRAAVLGANDGILSTSSLVLGVAAAHSTQSNILLAGLAGLVAGGMSMAAGEYVSVHSQADTEKADLELERKEQQSDMRGEHRELAAIYVSRGLDPELARQVAQQLMAHDALGSHTRDEIGITPTQKVRPIHAALTSAASFTLGGAMPLLVVSVATGMNLIPMVAGTSLVFLGIPGGSAAHAGGAPRRVGAMRVAFWGALAMAVTTGVGLLFLTVA
jgi:VIT1/CCC1 family predicted Fe2+/Mn2+ transporter